MLAEYTHNTHTHRRWENKPGKQSQVWRRDFVHRVDFKFFSQGLVTLAALSGCVLQGQDSVAGNKTGGSGDI